MSANRITNSSPTTASSSRDDLRSSHRQVIKLTAADLEAASTNDEIIIGVHRDSSDLQAKGLITMKVGRAFERFDFTYDFLMGGVHDLILASHPNSDDADLESTELNSFNNLRQDGQIPKTLEKLQAAIAAKAALHQPSN